MDEPTSALDPISTSKIEDLAETEKNYTIVMVTQCSRQHESPTRPRSSCWVK